MTNVLALQTISSEEQMEPGSCVCISLISSMVPW